MDYEALGGCFLIWAVPTLFVIVYVACRDAARNYPAWKAEQDRKKRAAVVQTAIRQQPSPVVPTPQELARQVWEGLARDEETIRASRLPERSKRTALRQALKRAEKRLRQILGG